MLLRISPDRKNYASPPGCRQSGRKFLPSGVAACSVLLAVFATTYQLSSQTPKDASSPILTPEANRPPDKNVQMAINEHNDKKASLEAANADRKRQIADDSARLLKMASDLKAEVDKTSKDMLSLGVIRRAEEIEKLARSVKEKMKLTMSGN